MAKTSSAWGRPPSRYYRFLRDLERAAPCDSVFDLCVIGCADGKFVLPAARRGMKVLAIDSDSVALFGGIKPGVGGDITIPGLVGRLRAEEMEARVEVVCNDFRTLTVKPKAS